MSFEELKSFAISDILSVSGKDKQTRVIENHMNNLIEVALIKGKQSQQSKIDKLQKRIDGAVDALENRFCDADSVDALSILKGEK